MGWHIHYSDGSTFSNQDGLPEEAPLDGVQLIVEVLSNGQNQYHWGRDFYFWTGDCWAAGYQADFERWVRAITKDIKYGLMMSNENFARFLKKVE